MENMEERQVSSAFSISFHNSTYFSPVFSISFHYSTWVSSIFGIYAAAATAAAIALKFHPKHEKRQNLRQNETNLPFFCIFHIFSLFNLGFFHIFHIFSLFNLPFFHE
jgi:hypothetical protein